MNPMPKKESVNRTLKKEEKEDAAEEKEIYSWTAPARPFKKRGKEFFTTVGSLAFLLGVIFLLIEGVLAVLVILSLVFLVYVLTTVPPGEITHKLTSRGLWFGEKRYAWDELFRFWFAERFGQEILIVEIGRFPGRLEFVIEGADKKELRNAIEKRVPYEASAPSYLDRAASWFSRKVPLEG